LIDETEEMGTLDRIRRHIEAGDDMVGEDKIEPVVQPLLQIWNRLAVLIQQPGSPAQDAHRLLGDLPPEPLEEITLSSIFGGRAQPTAQLPRTTEPLHPSIDKELLEELVAFDMAFGADQQVARESVVHALNLYARGQEIRPHPRAAQAL
jgi:intracellular multiplication protein IcmO